MENATSKILKLEPLNSGSLLEGIFQYQKNLMNKYISLGRLPALPLEINNRDNQKFLRKLINDFNEELAEASMEIDKGYEIMATQNYTEDDVQNEMKGYFKNAAVELADALHFLVELMVYSNIEPTDIAAYLRITLGENGLNALVSDDPLKTTICYAQHLNIHDDEARVAKYHGFKFTGLDHDNIFVCSKFNFELHTVINVHFWAISKKLLSAQNLLKMKDWRAEEINASVQSFQHKVMEAWITLFKLVDLMSLDDNLMYTAYENKNLINQQRIIDGY
jgi:hypothetical protein